MSTKRVGNYEIVRLLARGGTGLVYLVRQPALDREVVLKRLDLMADDPVLAQRFVLEARVAATLDHPNVVTLFDFFEDDGVPYIAMEYVAGGSLRALVGRVGPAQLFGVAEGILAGLGHAERHGVAHRDLKPENVLLTRRGNVKIADFGIARAYTAVTQRLTVTGSAIGTPAYMAPEQALNERIGPYTDLYALGVIVYELLAGRPPFDADTPVGILYRHVHTQPRPLREAVPDADPALCRWVEWLLQKQPAKRPQSAAEAWRALEEAAVAELGPYWRRVATLALEPAPPAGRDEDAEPATTTEPTRSEPGEDETVPLEGATLVAPPPAVAARPLKSRRPAAMAVAAIALLGGAAAAIGLLATGPGDPAPSSATPAPAPRPARAATPYDFDGNGRQELVVALLRGSPRGSQVHSGVVLVHRGRRRDPPWSVVSERRAGVPGRPRAGDRFGSGLASGDFDRDGHADLAIGTPGRERVSVLYGASRGLLGGRKQQLSGSRANLQAGAGRYGYILLAADLDRDGFDDLVVSAPGGQPDQPGTGALHLVFGGRNGLDPGRSRAIGRPATGLTGFGARLRAGDVDGDDRIDLVEGAPGRPFAPGHAFYCPGRPRGPTRCRELAPDSSTSGLAVADVDGDRRADVIQGDAGLEDPLSAGEVRVWLGSRGGPDRTPLTITQDTRRVPGAAVPGDGFGEIVGAGTVDADGYADMIVGAPSDNGGAGSVTVIRGGRDGLARRGHSQFGQANAAVPGTATPDGGFGAALTVLSLTGDRLLDIAVAAKAENNADERVMIVQGSRGIVAPDETRTTTLPGIAEIVTAPRDRRVRLARTAGS